MSYGNIRKPGALNEIKDITATKVTASAAEINKLTGLAATAAELDEFVLGTALITGLNTGSATATFLAPYACNVVRAYSNVSGDPGADTELALTVAGGTAATAVVTIANGSAAGTVDTATFADNNVAAAGEQIVLTSDNGASNVVNAFVTIVCTHI